MKTRLILPAALMLFPCLAAGCYDQNPSEPLVMLDTPADMGSAQPELVQSVAGDVYMTWVTKTADGSSRLHVSRFANQAWEAPQDIASGSDWFVNWADFPTLAVHENGVKAASFLAKSGKGTYAYDVNLTTTRDGQTWQPAFVPHTDGTQTEHGFVALLPWQTDRFFAAWLDGRNTGGGHDGHGGGAMTIRAAFFDTEGQITEETQLDEKTCDCCQTAAVRTGPTSVLVAYRDRSDEEIRDIAAVRYEDGAWTAPKIVHTDGWKIPGCPVNGPALARHADRVAIGWFTAANEKPIVKLALSDDRGATFGEPIEIDSGMPSGRVGVTFADENTVLISWLEQVEAGAEIRVRAVNASSADHLEKSPPFTLTKTNPSRQSGFPQMIAAGDRVFFAWTEVLEEKGTAVRSGYIERTWFDDLLAGE